MQVTQIISMLCNCSCHYCMNGTNNIHVPSNNEASLDDLIYFYENINEELDFKITGGEPLHPLTIDKTIGLVKYLIINHNIKNIQINTNGYFDIPEYLLKHRKISFQFSLDGDKEYQNKITGINIYDRLIRNIDMVVNIKRNSHIMSVITEDNLDYIWRIKCIGKEHKIPVKFQYVAPVGYAKNLNTDFAKQRIKEINDKYPNNCRNFINQCQTVAEQLKFAIDAYGNIIKCPYLQNYTTGLNIYNTRINEKNKIAQAINDKLKGRTCCTPQ